jgi:hypothetical protein
MVKPHIQAAASVVEIIKIGSNMIEILRVKCKAYVFIKMIGKLFRR